MTCSGGLEISSNFYGFDLYLKEHSTTLGELYKNHPVMSRIVASVIAAISGTIKVFLFPVISAIGLIALPIIALVRCVKGERNNGNWCMGSVYCLLGIAGSIAFFGITGFCLPVVASASLFAGAIAFSICIHVYKANKDYPEA